jgi:hypothetical protein
MKQDIRFKKSWVLLLIVSIWTTSLQGQAPDGYSVFISPGNNSCNAGQSFDVGSFSFPVQPGLTLSQINYLGTDVRASFSNPSTSFIIVIETDCGSLHLQFGINSGWDPDVWTNSGNVATPEHVVQFYCGSLQYMEFSAVKILYGNSVVTNIKVLSHENTSIVDFDNTRINNTTYTYDDCDGDGLLDIYDCNPVNNGNNKVYVCHLGERICVAMPALQAHLDHGDYMGSCQAISRPITISPEENIITILTVSPNPVASNLNLRNNTNKSLGVVSIHDMSGKIVYKAMIGTSQAMIDVKFLSPGVYILRSDQSVKPIRFIKQ